MAKYMRDRRAQRRADLKDILGGECVECGTTENLEFDHIDSSTKSETIASMLDAPLERLYEEIEKCQLLCKPCHRKKTVANGETGGGHNKILNPQHGTAVMYDSHRCRCRECRDWKRLYRNKRVDAYGNPTREDDTWTTRWTEVSGG